MVAILTLSASSAAEPSGASASTLGATRAPEARGEDQAAVASDGRPSPNSVYVEGLGAGMFWSINYERRVIDALGVRVGGGGMGVNGFGGNESMIVAPVTASWLGLRSGQHGLEVGGGVTLVGRRTSASDRHMSSPFGTALAGYRLHPIDAIGLQLRLGISALAAGGEIHPWPYASFGAAF